MCLTFMAHILFLLYRTSEDLLKGSFKEEHGEDLERALTWLRQNIDVATCHYICPCIDTDYGGVVSSRLLEFDCPDFVIRHVFHLEDVVISLCEVYHP